MKPIKKLNKKHLLFIEMYLTEPNIGIGDAAEKCGFARRYGYELLKKLQNLPEYEEVQDLVGLTLPILALKNRKLLDAKSPYWNPARMTFEYHDDNKSQIRALAIALQTRGKLISKQDISLGMKAPMTEEEARDYVLKDD